MWQPQGLYNQYVLRAPVILSGEESIRGLFNYPANKIAVIHGRSFSDHELFHTSFMKKDIRFFERSWKGEPDFEGLKETIHFLEEFCPDTIIAVGGGSVIDGCKLCRLFFEFPFYELGKTRLSGDLFKTRFIAVPTTVGSGAEVSSAAVFWDHDGHSKDMVVMHELQPDVVVYDYRYVCNTPKHLLCASSLDAMAHIIEGYVSKNYNMYMNIMAEKGLSIIHTELKKVLEKQEDSIDYKKLQYAGYIGGIVQNHCIVGAVHAIAHQMTEYGFAHGEAVALLLPAVILKNAENKAVFERYELLCRESGFSDIDELIGFIRNVCEVSEINIKRAKIKEMIMNLSSNETFCNNVRNDKGGKGNPVDITNEFISGLMENV